MPFYDLHIHTKYSGCCKEDYDYTDVADQIPSEFDGFGVSDHCNYSRFKPSFLVSHRKQQDVLDLRGTGLVGLEITILNTKGDIGANPKYLSQLDYYLISEHVHIAKLFSEFFRVKKKMRKHLRTPERSHSKIRKTIINVAELMKAGIRANPNTILAHIWRFPRNVDYIDAYMLERTEEICDLALANEVAIELHRSFFMSLQNPKAPKTQGGYSSFEFADFLFRLLQKHQVKLALGSDAHRLGHVGRLENWQEVLAKYNISERRFVTTDDLKHKYHRTNN